MAHTVCTAWPPAAQSPVPSSVSGSQLTAKFLPGNCTQPKEAALPAVTMCPGQHPVSSQCRTRASPVVSWGSCEGPSWLRASRRTDQSPCRDCLKPTSSHLSPVFLRANPQQGSWAGLRLSPSVSQETRAQQLLSRRFWFRLSSGVLGGCWDQDRFQLGEPSCH